MYLISNNVSTEWERNRWNSNGRPLHNIDIINIDGAFIENIYNVIRADTSQVNLDKIKYVTFIRDLTQNNNSVGYIDNDNNNVIIFPNTLQKGKTEFLVTGCRRKVSHPIKDFFMIPKGWDGNSKGVDFSKDKVINTKYYELNGNYIAVIDDKIILYIEGYEQNIQKSIHTESKIVCAYKKQKMFSFSQDYIFPNLEGIYELFASDDLTINAELWRYPKYSNHVSKYFRDSTFMKTVVIIYKNSNLVVDLDNMQLSIINEDGFRNNIDVLDSEYFKLEKNDRSLYYKIKDPDAQSKFININNIITLECVSYPNLPLELSGLYFDKEKLQNLSPNLQNGVFGNNSYIKILKKLK